MNIPMIIGTIVIAAKAGIQCLSDGELGRPGKYYENSNMNC